MIISNMGDGNKYQSAMVTAVQQFLGNQLQENLKDYLKALSEAFAEIYKRSFCCTKMGPTDLLYMMKTTFLA